MTHSAARGARSARLPNAGAGYGIEYTAPYAAMILERLAGMGLEPRLVDSAHSTLTRDGNG